MSAAFNWFWYVIEQAVQNLNFTIPLFGGLADVGFLDMIVVLFLLGIVIRNFVHIAR